MRRRSPAIWRALLIATGVFVVVMALLPHPPEIPLENDKLRHMLAFATLTILSVAAYPATPLPRIGERLSFLGAMIEVVQSLPVLNRTCDIMDWVADTAVVIGVLAVIALARRGFAAT